MHLDKSIRNIVFDFGGVLIDWNPRYLFRKVFKDEREMEYFLTEICNSKWNERFDAGESFEQGVIDMQKLHPEYKKEIALYRERWDETIGGEIESGISLVQRAKAAGYGIYGLSNWAAETFSREKPKHKIFDLFDGMIVSGFEGVIKPDPQIYKLLLSRFNLTAGECLFIDDNGYNLTPAQALGMKTLNAKDIASIELS